MISTVRYRAPECENLESRASWLPLTSKTSTQRWSLHNEDIIMVEPDKILRMRTVLQRTGLSRSTIYRKIKDGTFPNQVRISEHCCGWRESAINRWIADPVSFVEEKWAGNPANSTHGLSV